MTSDIPLHAIVEGHHMKLRLTKRRIRLKGQLGPARQAALPLARVLGNHFPHQIAANEARAGDSLFYETGIIEINTRDDALHRSASSQAAHECPRVDAC